MKRTERGQNLVETAIVIPILVLLLAGAVDIGRVFYGFMIITNAAREGARYGSRFPAHSAGIQQAAVDEAASAGIALALTDVTVTFPDGNSESGSPIRVTVDHTFDMWMSQVLGFATIPGSVQSDMIIYGLDQP